MADQKESWGPEIQEYSHHFDLQPAESSDPLWETNFPGAWRDDSIIPLSTLESSLARSDLKFGYCYGDRPLTALLLTLWNYHQTTNHSIFKYYYGFLCVRCITHMICIGILLETQTLNSLLESLDKRLKWKQLNTAIYREAMHQISSALPSQPWFNTRTIFKPVFGQPAPLSSVGSITSFNIILLVHLLWEDRILFFDLCKRGLLPGCTILLFTIHQVALITPAKHPDIRQLVLLDTTIRQYLVTSHLDRHILGSICLSAMTEAAGRDIAYWGEVIPEDACALADAYSELLESYYDDDGVDLVDMNVMTFIYQYVNSMLRRGVLSQQRIWTVLEDSMDFLWLVYSRKGNTLAVSRTPIRMYAALLFDSISFIQKELAKTEQEKLRFAKTIKENDLLALTGCTLLLATDRGTWYDQLPWAWSSQGYDQICLAFKEAISIAPHLFEESIVTWTKVLDHTQICYEMGHLSTHDYSLVMNAWSQFGIVLGARFVPQSSKCIYPRCFQKSTNEGILGVRFTCGRCGLATYCNQNCQRAHWQLQTADSHRLECAQSRSTASL